MRDFLGIDDVERLVPGLGVVEVSRLAGGTKKGVYRLRLGDGGTVVLYRWAGGENYWPPLATVPDDPFTGDAGMAEFAANHAALRGAGVRVPELLRLDHDGAFALVEDAGSESLERLMERDPAAAAVPLAELGAALRRMHADVTAHYGPLTRATGGEQRPAEDVVVDRALVHLAAVVERDARVAAARERIERRLRELRAAVAPRRAYALVHGELGADHVLVNAAGEPVMIDFEGLVRFDAEWDHAWLAMRFGDDYPRLGSVAPDPARFELYTYAQVLSLIEGPLRIADTDFPDRQWMLDLAEWNIAKVLR